MTVRSRKKNPSPRLAISVRGLKGRQSVRTTFRLPEESIRLIGLAAAHLGLKQKTLFDQLMEDEEVLELLAARAGEMARKERKNESRRQKTFVLSRRSLETLEAVARQRQVPRDLLVEVSIARLAPVMSDEQEKHRKRAALQAELGEAAARLRALEEKAARLLGRDDQAAALIREAARQCRASEERLAELVKSGEELEVFLAEGA